MTPKFCHWLLIPSIACHAGRSAEPIGCSKFQPHKRKRNPTFSWSLKPFGLIPLHSGSNSTVFWWRREISFSRSLSHSHRPPLLLSALPLVRVCVKYKAVRVACVTLPSVSLSQRRRGTVKHTSTDANTHTEKKCFKQQRQSCYDTSRSREIN